MKIDPGHETAAEKLLLCLAGQKKMLFELFWDDLRQSIIKKIKCENSSCAVASITLTRLSLCRIITRDIDAEAGDTQPQIMIQIIIVPCTMQARIEPVQEINVKY